jgi:nitroreductase
MNPVLETLRNRRSVRHFESRSIPKDMLNTLITAGNQAPSGSNAQPWRFVVVESEGARKQLAELALPVYRQWLASMPQAFQDLRKPIDLQMPDPVYYSAPAIVFVIGKGGGASALDCPMVCQNIMLAARSLGIGSCWVFIGSLAVALPEVKAMLSLEMGDQVYGPLVLGFPADGFPETPAKKLPVVTWR